MNLHYISSDQLTHISSNPFEDANFYLNFFKENSSKTISVDILTSLFLNFQDVRDRIFIYEFTSDDKKYKSRIEKYLNRAANFFQLYYKIKNQVNLDEIYELQDLYNVNQGLSQTDHHLEENDELKYFRKNLNELDIQAEKEVNNRSKSSRNKPIEEQLVFECYYKFALENGYYSFKDDKIKGRDAKSIVHELFKEEIELGLKISKSNEDYVRTNLRFFRDKNLFVKDNQLNEQIGENDKNIFYRLKFDENFYAAFEKRLNTSKEELHSNFLYEMQVYGIEPFKNN